MSRKDNGVREHPASTAGVCLCVCVCVCVELKLLIHYTKRQHEKVVYQNCGELQGYAYKYFAWFCIRTATALPISGAHKVSGTCF